MTVSQRLCVVTNSRRCGGASRRMMRDESHAPPLEVRSRGSRGAGRPPPHNGGENVALTHTASSHRLWHVGNAVWICGGVPSQGFPQPRARRKRIRHIHAQLVRKRSVLGGHESATG